MSDKAPSSTPGTPGAPSKPGSGDKQKSTPADDQMTAKANPTSDKDAAKPKT